MSPSKSNRQSLVRIAGERLADEIEARGRAMAKAMGTPYGTTEISAKEERRLFWLRKPGVDEQALWAQGKNPSEISRALYPIRWELLSMGGRITKTEQVKWAKHMLGLGPPDDEPTANVPAEPAPTAPSEPAMAQPTAEGSY